MMCPVCPVIGMTGGFIGGYLGFKAPERTSHRILAAVITSTLMGITVVALRSLFGLTLCDGNGNFSYRNIAQVGAITIVLGIVYSIGVNILINLAVSALETPQNSPDKPLSCCNKKLT